MLTRYISINRSIFSNINFSFARKIKGINSLNTNDVAFEKFDNVDPLKEIKISKEEFKNPNIKKEVKESNFSKEAKEEREFKEPRVPRENREPRVQREDREPRFPKENREPGFPRAERENRESRPPREKRDYNSENKNQKYENNFQKESLYKDRNQKYREQKDQGRDFQDNRQSSQFDQNKYKDRKERSFDDNYKNNKPDYQKRDHDNSRYKKADSYGENDRSFNIRDKENNFSKERKPFPKRENNFESSEYKNKLKSNNDDDYLRNQYNTFRNKVNSELPSKQQKEVKAKDNLIEGEERFTFQKDENIDNNLLKYDYLYGAHVIKLALTYNKRKTNELIILNNYKEKMPENIQEIVNLTKEIDISISYASKEKLDRLTAGKPHNGLILKTDKKEYSKISILEEIKSNEASKKQKVFLLIDQIIDCQNFGSIIRSAYFLGVDAVIVNSINQHSLSPMVSKISSGASECMDIYSTNDIELLLKDAKSNNYLIVSADIEHEKDVTIKPKLTNQVNSNNQKADSNTAIEKVELKDINFPDEQNIIIHLTSVSDQVSKNENLSKYITFKIDIKPQISKGITNDPSTEIVNSLNVGVSAGIIINHIISSVKINKNNKI